jgi:hypothetical protein
MMVGSADPNQATTQQLACCLLFARPLRSFLVSSLQGLDGFEFDQTVVLLFFMKDILIYFNLDVSR